MASVNKRKKTITAACTVLALLCAAIALFPLVWMIISSFKNSKEILKANPLRFFPTVWTLENYVALFEDTTYPFLQAMGNTAFVSITAALLSVTINSMAGYAFARLNFTGKTALCHFRHVYSRHYHFGDLVCGGYAVGYAG